MPRFSVLLNGRGIRLKEEGQEPERGGFFVPCVVEAAGEESAGERAIALLRADPRFLALECWPGEGALDGRPQIVVSSVERLPWWNRRRTGITCGFILYPGADESG